MYYAKYHTTFNVVILAYKIQRFVSVESKFVLFWHICDFGQIR